MVELATSVRALLMFTILLGAAYPLVIGTAAALIPAPAPAELIGQPFERPEYLWGRPSAIGYDATTSGGTNLAPGHPALRATAAARLAALGGSGPVPLDLVTSSGSGLDPHITPEAAYYQAARVARARRVPEARVRELIAATVEDRTFGILGEPRVSVVRVNRALDAWYRRRD